MKKPDSASPTVSVIIPSYNHARFLGEAIRSVLEQDYRDLELLITDDASTDDSAKVAASFSDDRIRLKVLPQNCGACAAMNDLITRARGHYVAVLNSDDCFKQGKLTTQVAFLEAHPKVGAVFALPEFMDEEGNPLPKGKHAFNTAFLCENRTRQEWLRHLFFHPNCFCHPTVMLRRSCYEKVGLLDPLMMQVPDLDLWVRLLSAFEVHVLPEKLIKYRVLKREANVSAPTPESLARLANELPEVLRHYASLGDDDLRVVLQLRPDQAEWKRPKLELALQALTSDRIPYGIFGARLLAECLKEDPSCMSAREYFARIGKADPCGARFDKWELRRLARSPVYLHLRKFITELRRRCVNLTG